MKYDRDGIWLGEEYVPWSTFVWMLAIFGGMILIFGFFGF